MAPGARDDVDINEILYGRGRRHAARDHQTSVRAIGRAKDAYRAGGYESAGEFKKAVAFLKKSSAKNF
jgi:hypothetical protein